MTRLGRWAILLSAFVVIGSTGCCCTTGPCGGYGDPYGGCHDTGCCETAYGHCHHPVASTVGLLLTKLFTCGAGCGECYMGPVYDHPGGCCDSCGPAGYYGHHRPILNGFKRLWGYPYHGGYEVGCSSCGGGGVTSDCGCHGGGSQMVPMRPMTSVEEVPSAIPSTNVPTEARRIRRMEPRSMQTRRVTHVSGNPTRRVSHVSSGQTRRVPYDGGNQARRASHVSPARR